MSRLYLEFFYRHSITEMLLWGVLLTAIWNRLTRYSQKAPQMQQIWIWINRCVLLAIIPFILWRTLGNRTGSTREICLTPFYTFIAAKESPERYRILVANILLFLSMGLSMPFVLHRKGRGTRLPVLLTICTALLLSVAVEAAQYHWALGLCETDDVIFNTFGTAFGTMAFAAALRRRGGYLDRVRSAEDAGVRCSLTEWPIII